jgi:hypothetical protein
MIRDKQLHQSHKTHILCHDVDVICEVFPSSSNVLDDGLATKNTLRSDLSSDARDLISKDAQRLRHLVDGCLQIQDFALDVDL